MGSPIQACPDFVRIDALPRRVRMASDDAACAELLTRKLGRGVGQCADRAEPCPLVLNADQGRALIELGAQPAPYGAVLPFVAGVGKTLVSLLAGTIKGSVRPVLVVPAKLRDKTRIEWAHYAKHWRCHESITIIAYEQLSRVGYNEWLDNVRPDLIVLDEAHRAKNAKAACSSKLAAYLRWADRAGYPVTVVVMSGTLARIGLGDYATLVRWALRDRAPVPTLTTTIGAWDTCLGAGDESDDLGEAAGILTSWVPRGRAAFVELIGTEYSHLGPSSRRALRAGFRDRMLSTPGVVASKVTTCDAALTLDLWSPRVPAEITKALADLEAAGELPDGQTEGSALEMYRHESTFALGFWDRWRRPPPAVWRQCRRLWHNLSRRTISHSRAPHELHSTRDVANAIDSGRKQDPTIKEYVERYEIEGCEDALVAFGPAPVLAAWRTVKPTFEPDSAPVWLSSAMVDAAETWLREGPGILWCESVAFARALEDRGWPYYGAGGTDRKGVMIEAAKGAIVASRPSSGEGRNLQRWARNLFVQPLPDAQTWEQTLARTHRQGQMADEVTADVACFVAPHGKQLAEAWRRARLLGATWGQPQRLLSATRTDALMIAMSQFEP